MIVLTDRCDVRGMVYEVRPTFVSPQLSIHRNSQLLLNSGSYFRYSLLAHFFLG